jgi:hypothetical protein
MAFLGALERVREEDSLARFLIKGGMACELRRCQLWRRSGGMKPEP